jgi:KDO2-lipid IV(A) lauroyltransferase
MSEYTYGVTPFSIKLLSPQYWIVWLGFGLLALLVNLLPYSMSLKLGHLLGALGMKFAKKRVAIARRNFELAFPEKSHNEIEHLVVANLKNSGAALIETGIAWFWPTWRFKRRLINKDLSALEHHQKNGRGVLLCCVHQLNLEITARAFAVLDFSGYGVYRPHSNAAYEFIQSRGRTRNGNKLIYRRDLKKMIQVMRRGERLFYLPDQDYGHNKSVFAPFFAVEEACTTTGTSILANASKSAIVIGSGFRNEHGYYDILADVSVEENYPGQDDVAAAGYMNHYIEQVILRAPAQWLWLHKRFKSLPDHTQTNSRYTHLKL